MASKYWIKLYHEILDDHKMGMLSDHLYRRVIELFLLAGEFDGDGELPTVEAMAWRLRTDQDELLNDLETLRDKKIVTLHNNKWIVTKFAERQAPVSDAERMRRLRERKQKEQYYGDAPVTSPVTNRKTDTDTDKIRKDIESESHNNGGGLSTPERSNLLEKFEELTKIQQPAEMLDPKGFMVWEKEIAKWESMEVTIEGIQEAVEKADELKSNLSWPGSITKYMASAIARRKRGVSDNHAKDNAQEFDEAKFIEELLKNG
jgi:hypothetical protein